jgi:hypothetical protein
MGRNRLQWAVIGLTAVFLALPAQAFGAGPSEIHRDYLDNGRLDGKYTKAELEKALRSPLFQGYEQPTVREEVRSEIAERQTPPSQAPQSDDEPQGDVAQVGVGGSLPFTGLELAFIAGAGILLLGVGFAFRRLSASNR